MPGLVNFASHYYHKVLKYPMVKDNGNQKVIIITSLAKITGVIQVNNLLKVVNTSQPDISLLLDVFYFLFVLCVLVLGQE